MLERKPSMAGRVVAALTEPIAEDLAAGKAFI